MKLLKLIYETLLSWVSGLRETRKQLLWIAVFLFMWSVKKGVDPVNLGIIAGLLTTVFYWYFKSKELEHKHIHEKDLGKSKEEE